jgi:hypothetical protein
MKPRAVERQTQQTAQGQRETEQFIRRRAHELYLSRGQQPGHEMDDWLQAERELKGKARQQPSKR